MKCWFDDLWVIAAATAKDKSQYAQQTDSTVPEIDIQITSTPVVMDPKDHKSLMNRYAAKKLNKDYYSIHTFINKGEAYKRESCECGGETTNTTHSNWCPKHE